MIEHQFTFHGNVQGVNFRRKTKELCDMLSLKGFVKNQSDGSVFLLLQGEEKKIHLLLKELEDNFSIENVIKEAKESSQKYDAFSIER